LEARLATSSTNLSKPPYFDSPGTARHRRQASGRMWGGQKGHQASRRSLLPLKRVDEVVEHRPAECRHCHRSLDGALEVSQLKAHQVIELPKIRANLTEHRAPLLSCPRCGKRTRGQIHRALTFSHFGPQLVAKDAELISRFRLNRRDLDAFYTALLDVPAPS